MKLGWEQPLAPRVHGLVELGYGQSEWKPRTDIEAVAFARCIGTYGIYTRVEQLEGLPAHPHCEPVDITARSGGFIGRAAVRGELSKRVDLSFGWSIQNYRYYVARNVIFRRMVNRNRDISFPHLLSGVSISTERASWTWFTARTDLHLRGGWGAYLLAEVGGTRDWSVLEAGLTWRF